MNALKAHSVDSHASTAPPEFDSFARNYLI